MDTKIKAEHLRSFAALQGHFTKQLIGKYQHCFLPLYKPLRQVVITRDERKIPPDPL
jgi:hypothetical protein